MKNESITIKNFRSYAAETTIHFDDFTAFVGRNDIGKSTVLEALDIFFYDGKGLVKLDKNDVNVSERAGDKTDISISVCFCNLPATIIIDATNETTLQDEHLLNKDGLLEITKRFPNGGSPKISICAMHPTNPDCCDLLSKKDSDLKKLIKAKSIPCDDYARNASMRTAIWQYYAEDLRIEPVEIDVTKGDTKSIWDKLQKSLPLYSLFQSDRKNSDTDSEVQDPLREAVKEILCDEALRSTLDEVAATVETKLQDVASRTLEKLREMNPDVANTLSPIIPSADALKWADVFKSVSIAGDESIPINKRGSGTKRLILLNFFRAEVERRQTEAQTSSVIYAIEEPETSQHSENQKRLIQALSELAKHANVQVIITTHSATIVRALAFNNIRLIRMLEGQKVIENVAPRQLPFLSLNEVNYLAFSEISEGYHNELYGYIEEMKWLKDYLDGKPTVEYTRIAKDGSLKVERIPETEYIRHQIHHPENTHNPRFTDEQLRGSIETMRAFIIAKGPAAP